MVDHFCLPQKILSTIQERILSGFIPHRTPIAMISQTEWIMALKKQISHDFYSKLTCLENAAVKGIVSRVTTLSISQGPFIWWGCTDPHGANKQKGETTLVLEIEISRRGDNCRTGRRHFPVCKIIDYFFTSGTVRMQLWHTSHHAWRLHTYLVTWSCPTLYDPMGCSPPGSSVYAIFQARLVKQFAFATLVLGIKYK